MHRRSRVPICDPAERERSGSDAPNTLTRELGMDCATFTLIVTGERSTDLSRDESAAFDAHLDACAKCRDALAHAEDELQPLVERMTPPELPAEQWARVHAAVKAEAALGVPRERRAIPLYVAIAAAVLFTLTVGLLFPLDVITGQKGAGGDQSAYLHLPVTEPPRSAGPPQEPSEKHPVVVDAASLSFGERYEGGVNYLNEGEDEPGPSIPCIYVAEKNL